MTPASATFRSRYLQLINRTRVHHDLRPLRLNVNLSGSALAHTRKMIRKNRLFDVEGLAQLLDPYSGFKTMGADVVGCGATLIGIRRLLMLHPAHRRILLSPKMRYVGIGVLKVTGRSSCGKNEFWTTAILYG